MLSVAPRLFDRELPVAAAPALGAGAMGTVGTGYGFSMNVTVFVGGASAAADGDGRKAESCAFQSSTGQQMPLGKKTNHSNSPFQCVVPSRVG